MKNSRQRKAESKLHDLEIRYRQCLIAGLHICAKGEWGLFRRYEDIISQPRYVKELLELGKEIVTLRLQLGYNDDFELYKKYTDICDQNIDDNTLGEPRIAQQWLAELDQ